MIQLVVAEDDKSYKRFWIIGEVFSAHATLKVVVGGMGDEDVRLENVVVVEPLPAGRTGRGTVSLVLHQLILDPEFGEAPEFMRVLTVDVVIEAKVRDAGITADATTTQFTLDVREDTVATENVRLVLPIRLVDSSTQNATVGFTQFVVFDDSLPGEYPIEGIVDINAVFFQRCYARFQFTRLGFKHLLVLSFF